MVKPEARKRTRCQPCISPQSLIGIRSHEVSISQTDLQLQHASVFLSFHSPPRRLAPTPAPSAPPPGPPAPDRHTFRSTFHKIRRCSPEILCPLLVLSSFSLRSAACGSARRRFRSQTPHELCTPWWDINRRNEGGDSLPGGTRVGS